MKYPFWAACVLVFASIASTAESQTNDWAQNVTAIIREHYPDATIEVTNGSLYANLAPGLGDAGLIAKNRSYVITSKPAFQTNSGWVYLSIADSNYTKSLLWSVPPEVRFAPVVLSGNHAYDFTVVEHSFGDSSLPELLLIRSNGITIYDASVCDIHKVKMEYKQVPVAYGLPLTSPPGKAASALFPHYAEYSLGGCAVSENSPKFVEMFVCEKCKQAFAWWSGKTKAPASLLPATTPYDHNPPLRGVFLDAFSQGYVAAWSSNQGLPVFGPNDDKDKARVFGFEEGLQAGRAGRAAWSNSAAQPYGPVDLPKTNR